MQRLALRSDVRNPSQESELHEALALAPAFQQALDSGTESFAAAAGKALSDVVRRQILPYRKGGGRNKDFLEPIITGTTLATSMVRYLERIPWPEVTPQMLLLDPEGTPGTALYAAEVCGLLLLLLCESAVAAVASDETSLVPALLLRQVRTLIS